MNIQNNTRRFFNFILLVVLLEIAGCATSMTPMEVNRTLPTLTNTKYISANSTDDCTVIHQNRIYNVPIGLSVKRELANGAKGIDEWVKLDGGNAYRLINYQWITVDDLGSTQLKVEFSTLKCELNN